MHRCKRNREADFYKWWIQQTEAPFGNFRLIGDIDWLRNLIYWNQG